MTLFTSDKNTKRKFSNLLFYTVSSIFFAVFGFIYEQFSHEVYSDFMMFACFIPLIFGIVPFVIAFSSEKIHLPRPMITQLYGSGIITLTIGSVMKGVLDIYGTTNGKIIVYPVAGGLMVVISLIMAVIGRVEK
ncbi:MAG: hypothetical protein IJU14_07735 [Clostridia bacterium]|nr:hypothetical protein [Clostridia bacterium]